MSESTFTDEMVDEALFSQAEWNGEETYMLIDIMGMGSAEKLPLARCIIRAALEHALAHVAANDQVQP